MKNLGNLLWGIVLIIVGSIWGLNALGITNINIFFDGWWTLIIIIPSLIGILKDENKTGSLVFLVIGILLLLCAQNVVSFSILRKIALPLILIIIGVCMLFGNAIHSKVNEKIKSVKKGDLTDYVATFSGQKVNFQNEKFTGANIDAVFGGVELDLRGAILEGENIIHATAVFGGIEIYVPQGIKVKVKSTPIFGGVSNKTYAAEGENVPTIYVNAVCLFGGVEIK